MTQINTQEWTPHNEDFKYSLLCQIDSWRLSDKALDDLVVDYQYMRDSNVATIGMDGVSNVFDHPWIKNDSGDLVAGDSWEITTDADGEEFFRRIF